jgi:hypothetical protein
MCEPNGYSWQQISIAKIGQIEETNRSACAKHFMPSWSLPFSWQLETASNCTLVYQ